MASANNSAQDSGSDFDRFMSTWVRRPSKLPSTVNDDAPPRQRVQQSDIHRTPGPPDPSRETLGAMHRLSTTRAYPGAHEPGMPAGWTSAANPAQRPK